MPSLVTKRGKKRYRGSVTVRELTKQKLFPDASKKSYRAAVVWENETRKVLEEKSSKTDMDYLSVLNWTEEYLDYVQERFAIKTYQEKRFAFKNLLRLVQPNLLIKDLSISVSLEYLRKQAKERTGHAANKDRKNLGAAWEWGRKYMDGFPKGENPFRVVDRFPEERQPRYVPPEEDFWRVYGIAEKQDQVMLLAFLHLAARRGEIFGLTWSDVDFSNDRIRLWTSKRKGGDKEHDWLPMTSELRETLLNWWQKRLAMSTTDKEHVFVCLEQTALCDVYYGRPFRVRQHLMKRLCKKAGVKPFGFHAIRHLTASILYRKGYSVAHIQAILRHQNPNTTSRYLKSLGLEQVREALEEGLKGPAKEISLHQEKTSRTGSSGG